MLLLTANIFQPLIDVFEAVLKFFHNNLGISWGFSIILLTVVMRAVLVPLTIKQFHSMQKLQRLGPELKAIQAKYKDDKQRQQQETMKFYKENEINPLGSCLPLVLQLPVFISLFYMLRQDLRKNICPDVQAHFQANYAHTHHITLAQAAGQTTPCGPGGGAHFLFIPDLTDRATGWVLLLLLVLYVGSQVLSTLMMSSPMMDRSQRMLMLLLPLFFVVIVISFPAGLLVYWITTNLWTMGQQYVVRKIVGPVGPLPAPAGAAAAVAGGGGRAGPTGRGGGGKPPPQPEPNGSGAGGLGGLLRGKPKPEPQREAVTTGSRSRRGAPPPPPPRKKKKRSGRRR